jgi:hypothetical protein
VAEGKTVAVQVGDVPVATINVVDRSDPPAGAVVTVARGLHAASRTIERRIRGIAGGRSTSAVR